MRRAEVKKRFGIDEHILLYPSGKKKYDLVYPDGTKHELYERGANGSKSFIVCRKEV